jgi:hypothetical protein
MAKIESAGEGNPYLFLTFDDRTLTATDGDLDSECRIAFREYDQVMNGTMQQSSRWGRNTSATRRRSNVVPVMKHAEIPILKERLHPDPYDHNQTKMFKVWYKVCTACLLIRMRPPSVPSAPSCPLPTKIAKLTLSEVHANSVMGFQFRFRSTCTTLAVWTNGAVTPARTSVRQSASPTRHPDNHTDPMQARRMR